VVKVHAARARAVAAGGAEFVPAGAERDGEEGFSELVLAPQVGIPVHLCPEPGRQVADRLRGEHGDDLAVCARVTVRLDPDVGLLAVRCALKDKIRIQVLPAFAVKALKAKGAQHHDVTIWAVPNRIPGHMTLHNLALAATGQACEEKKNSEACIDRKG